MPFSTIMRTGATDHETVAECHFGDLHHRNPLGRPQRWATGGQPWHRRPHPSACSMVSSEMLAAPSDR